MVAISSNDAAAYPADAPGSLREMAIEAGFSFPVCYDESQEWRGPTRPSALRTSSCLTANRPWSIAAAWTKAGRTAESR